MKESNLDYKVMIHELKNALTICQGYIEIIERDYTSNYLKIIKKEINRSLNIIYNDNSLKREEIDLELLLIDIKETLEHYYLQNNCQIVLNIEELCIEGDYDKLKQLFINLLKNSMEANASLIELTLKNRQNNIQIIIEDNGIGMDRNQINAKLSTKEHGTGIGLAFCKEVIKQHDGNIKISSSKGKGTKILLTIPKKVRRLSFNNSSY